MTTWIVRHAESTANAGAATSDPATIPLSSAGERQAARLAAWMPVRPALIVTSPYHRTLATARPLLARYPDVAHEQWPIHEFTYLPPASYTNTTASQRAGDVYAYWERSDPEHCGGPGAESLVQFAGRVAAFEERLARIVEPTVIFTHGQFMQALLFRASGGDLLSVPGMRAFREFCRRTTVANTAVLELPSAAPWTVRTPHL